MRLMFAISIPAMVGFLLLGEPILKFLFEWGAFDAADTSQTLPLLWAFALGLPLYSMVALLVRAFYAHKDTRTPMIVAVFSFVLNLSLSLALMWPLGVVGLALANVLAILGQAVLLTAMLSKFLQTNLLKDLSIDLLKIIGGSLVMIGFIYLSIWVVAGMPLTDKGEAAVQVLVVIPIAAALYFLVLWLLKFWEMDQLQALVKRFLKKDKPRVA
jgi:putative peptidoglycan lipid II flippase